MKFTLNTNEIQSLIAKALNIPTDTVSISIKELVVDVTKGVEDLSFGTVAAAIVPEPVEVKEPKSTKAKSGKAASKAAAVEEEETEEFVEEDDEDDIDFL